MQLLVLIRAVFMITFQANSRFKGVRGLAALLTLLSGNLLLSPCLLLSLFLLDNLTTKHGIGRISCFASSPMKGEEEGGEKGEGGAPLWHLDRLLLFQQLLNDGRIGQR